MVPWQDAHWDAAKSADYHARLAHVMGQKEGWRLARQTSSLWETPTQLEWINKALWVELAAM